MKSIPSPTGQNAGSGRRPLFSRSLHASALSAQEAAFGLAVLEALACGTPVVTADRGGASELITSRCGEWGSPDSSGIADAIERLAGRLSAQVRIAARSHACEFDWSRPISRMMDIHEQAAEKGRRAR